MAKDSSRKTHVMRRYQDIVQRSCLLRAVFGKTGREDQQVIDITEQLQKMWAARIDLLVKNGWCGELGRSRGTYMKNCPPGFLCEQPATRICTRRFICPFCYARRVRDLWTVVDAAFSDEVARVSHDLVRRIHRMPLTYDSNQPVARLVKQLRDVAVIVPTMVRQVKPKGAIFQTVIVPGDADAPWLLEYRQFYKIGSTQVLPEVLTGDVKRIRNPRKRQIMSAVGASCPYPKELLTGDVTRTLQLLEAYQESKFRSINPYREFRSFKQDKS